MSIGVYDETTNIGHRECPYCGHEHRVESEDFDEGERVQTCNSCKRNFHATDSITVEHHARPDCTLNGAKHKWIDLEVRSRGEAHPFCSECGQCMDFDKIEAFRSGHDT